MSASALRIAEVSCVGAAAAAVFVGSFNDMKFLGGVPVGVVDCTATKTRQVSEALITENSFVHVTRIQDLEILTI